MKKYTFIMLCLLGIFTLYLTSCQEDTLIDEETTTEPVDNPTEFFETQLKGIILDTDGSALADVQVYADGKETTTDALGFYTLEGLSSPNTGLYVKAQKEGYFVGGTHYFPNSVETTNPKITLIKQDIQVFESANGFNKQLTGGANLLIPANGVSLDGQAYQGEVNIASTWLNPENAETFNTMPGALLGVTESGESKVLQSFGMIAVEMEDNNGNELQLSEGVKATLTFPLSSNLLSSANNEIPLWHFDEVNGVWKEEGKATQTNNAFIAEVSHFSWWNCDEPFDLTRLCLTVVDQFGNTIQNYRSCLTDGINIGCNPNGNSCGLIPAGTTMTLELYDICNNLFHSEPIGPYTGGINQTHNLTINANLTGETMSFSGNVYDCTGAIITDNAVVSLTIGNNTYYDLDIDANGYDVTFINCDQQATDVTISAVNLDNLESHEDIYDLVSGQNDYVQDLSTCGQVLSGILTINSPAAVQVFEDCTLIQNAAETLIIAKTDSNTSSMIIGFKGFDEGTFGGNIFTDLIPTAASEGLVDEATITIDNYGGIGELVTGSFSENGGQLGTFSIKRER